MLRSTILYPKLEHKIKQNLYREDNETVIKKSESVKKIYVMYIFFLTNYHIQFNRFLKCEPMNIKSLGHLKWNNKYYSALNTLMYYVSAASSRACAYEWEYDE